MFQLRELTDDVPVGVPAAIVTDDGSVVGVVSERVARLRVVRDDGARARLVTHIGVAARYKRAGGAFRYNCKWSATKTSSEFS